MRSPRQPKGRQVSKMNWVNLTILILNTVLTFLTNFTVNQKRDQTRSTD